VLKGFALIVTVGLASVYLSDANSDSLLRYLVFPAVAFLCALALFYWFLLFIFKIRMQRLLLQREQDTLSTDANRTD